MVVFYIVGLYCVVFVFVFSSTMFSPSTSLSRVIDPEEEPYRAFIESLTDKEYQVLQIAKEIQVGLFDISATNIYIQWKQKQVASSK